MVNAKNLKILLIGFAGVQEDAGESDFYGEKSAFLLVFERSPEIGTGLDQPQSRNHDHSK